MQNMRKITRTEFGERVFLLRKAAGIGQAELGKKCGLSQSTIADLESVNQGSAAVTKLALVFGVDPHWLATGEGEKLPVKCPLSPQLQRAIAGLAPDELQRIENQLRVQLDMPLISMQEARKLGNGK